MSEIFVSYANEDKEFALGLVDNLAKRHKVWIDRKGITGGMEWEQKIDTAIRECEIFLVVVSPRSNNSTWVKREVIHAERLSKLIVPILLDGELPLSLLHLHYVDFRADQNGGFNDLLKVTNALLSAQEMDIHEINRLIGEGIRVFLEDDYPAANNLIEQAAILDSKVGERLLNWWAKINEKNLSHLSEILMSKISILEKAELSKVKKYSEGNTYEWSLEVKTDRNTLEKVDYVKYMLHPTFSNPERIIRDKNTFFRLKTYGWGIFKVPIEVHFVDGTLGYTEHQLTFDLGHD